jgi:hypothetical protein
VQDEPTSAQLLGAIADVLETRVRDELTGSGRHQVRVVANLCRILAREHALDPSADRAALSALSAVLGVDDGASSSELWRRLAVRIDEAPLGEAEGDALARAAHPVVLEIVRGKLAVVKPGYDA